MAPPRSMGKRAKLPGTSKTPLWLMVALLQVVLQAGFVAMVLLVPELNRYLVIGVAFVCPILTTLMVLALTRRAGFLTKILLQDPQVIVGDPAAMKQLKVVKWYGVKEFDELQRAILATYLAYQEDRHNDNAAGGATGLISHDAHYHDETASWHSAESGDADGNYADNYVLEHVRNQRKRRFSFGSRQSSTLGTPRSNSLGGDDLDFRSMPASSYQSTGSLGGYGSYGEGRSDTTGGRVSVITSYGEEDRPLLARSATQQQEGGRNRSLNGSSPPPSIRNSAAQSNGAASPASTAVAVPGFPGPVEDPLNDNLTAWRDVFRGVTDPGSSIFLQLIKQVRPGQTLTTITLPFHILEPRSMIERISDVWLHSEFLLPLSIDPANPSTASTRASQASFFTIDEMNQNPYWKLISLFRWFISAYSLRPEGARKPYNSILGEVLYAAFHHGEPETEVRYLAEQVCHHPPISAFYAEGAGIRAHATYYPKSKLVSPNCAAGFGEGSIEIEVKSTKEKFTVTWPNTYASGFVTGNTRMELGGEVKVVDHQTKCVLKMDFLRKGWISGSYDTIKGAVYDAQGKKTQHRFEGIWHMVTRYDDGVNGSRVLYDPAAFPPIRPVVLPFDHPKQTRHVWRHLTKALRENNPEAAAPAKHEVETIQRAERKALAAKNEQHKPHFFKWVGPGDVPEKEKSVCVADNWQFSGQKFVEDLK